MKLLSILLITLLLVQAFVEAKSASEATDYLSQEDGGGNSESLVKKHKHRKINCSKECSRRCIKSSRRRNLCYRACRSCCARCNCVPPGVYGNKSLCPCYANLKTHENRPKCP